jgi:hypothetical protein
MQVLPCPFHENIQVTHVPQGPTGNAQLLERFLYSLRLEIWPKHIKGSAHSPGRHAHIMKLFYVFAQARSRFVAEHAGKMESQGFSPGFHHRIRRFYSRIFPYTRKGSFPLSRFWKNFFPIFEGFRLSAWPRG